MALPQNVRRALEKQDHDSIENEWIAHQSEAPDDLDFFVGVARGLTGVGQEERARFLLEMLDEGLKEKGHWEIRYNLLRRAGTILFEPEDVHPAIIETLEGLHGDTPSFDGLVQAVRLDKAPHDLNKNWEKADRLRDLVPYDVGAVVLMKGKGAGTVTDVNLELDSLKVDFPGHPGLSVGFRAAPKMLEPLAAGHVLRRKMEEPEALKTIGAEDPPELLRIVLESFDRPLEAGEVKSAVEGVVPAKKWTSWWAAARKHPQVMAHGKGRQSYTWLASEGKALDAVWQRFEKAEPRDRITLLKKEGERDDDLASRMAGALADQARKLSAAGSAPDDRALAFEIAWALGSGAPGAKSADAPPPAEVLTGTVDPRPVLAAIEDRGAKEGAYQLLREEREDWVQVYSAQILRETEPKVLDLLADALSDESPQDLLRFAETVAGQPAKNPPAFAWLAERATHDEQIRSRAPLRFLEQILGALVDQRFVPYRVRLAKLVESGGTVPKLLDHLETRHAERAEEAIHKAAALEPFQRDALTNALHLRFPELRGEGTIDVIYSTPEAIEARREELSQLVKHEIPANRKAIEEARALGDLRENFEYKSARARHEYLSSRQAQLEGDLNLARPIDASQINTSQVRIGTTVELAESGGDGTRTITILGPWDSKPEDDILAYETDLAKALLGKAPGEEIEAAGTTYEVKAIRPYR